MYLLLSSLMGLSYAVNKQSLVKIIYNIASDNSGAPAAQKGCQAEPHTHMRNKRKPMSWFSHGYHGLRYCSRVFTHDGGNRVAQHGGHTPNNGITETCSLGLLCASLILDIHLDTCPNKVSADQKHVTILQARVYHSLRSSVFLSWLLTKCWFFDWIVGSFLVKLLKTGQDC